MWAILRDKIFPHGKVTLEHNDAYEPEKCYLICIYYEKKLVYMWQCASERDGLFVYKNACKGGIPGNQMLDKSEGEFCFVNRRPNNRKEFSFGQQKIFMEGHDSCRAVRNHPTFAFSLICAEAKLLPAFPVLTKGGEAFTLWNAQNEGSTSLN